MPVSASLNQYATWDDGISSYATLEAAPSYGVMEGGRLSITRTLPSAGNLLAGFGHQLTFGGALGSFGGPSRQLTQRYAGSLGSSALVLLGKSFSRALAGSLTSSGALVRNTNRAVSIGGGLAPYGDAVLRLQNTFYPSYSGFLYVFGNLSLCVRRCPPALMPLPPVGAPPTCDAYPKPAAPMLAVAASFGAPLLTGDPECRP